jgi:CBS domain-containing protein
MDDERDYYSRDDRLRRENFGGYDESWRGNRRFDDERRSDYNRGRFGERAEYDYDEPRYANYGDRGERYRDDARRSSLYEGRGDLGTGRWRDREYGAERSRLRCRDIMTRELVVATRDTTIVEVSRMMKQEDVGVIPVVEYDAPAGNGRSEERNYQDRNYARGKLIGLITDRDIVVRCVADNKDCASVRAEDIMSVDIHTAKPNDRVVDVIRKMGDKQVRRIPVCNDNGYLVGMISMADVALETRQDRELNDALEEISKGSSFWNRIFG